MACKISSLEPGQSTTLEAFNLPSCLDPIFTAGILKVGASSKALDEFPIITSAYLRHERYLSWPKLEKSLELELSSQNSFISL